MGITYSIETRCDNCQAREEDFGYPDVGQKIEVDLPPMWDIDEWGNVLCPDCVKLASEKEMEDHDSDW